MPLTRGLFCAFLATLGSLLAAPAQAQIPVGHDYSLERLTDAVVVPLQMDFDANGELYVGNGFVDPLGPKVDIFRVSPDGTTVPVGDTVADPDALQIGPDGAIYTGAFGGKIYRLDPLSGQHTTWMSFAALGNIDGLEFDGNDLYVVAFDHPRVYRVDFLTKAGAVFADLGPLGFTGLTGIVRDPFGPRILVGAPNEGTIAALDLAGNVLDPAFSDGYQFQGHIAFDDSGAHGQDAFVADNGAGIVYRVDAVTGQKSAYIDAINPLTGGVAFDSSGRLHASRLTNIGKVGEIWREGVLDMQLEGQLYPGPLARSMQLKLDSPADAFRRVTVVAALQQGAFPLGNGRFLPVSLPLTVFARGVLDADGRIAFSMPPLGSIQALRGRSLYFSAVVQREGSRRLMGISSAYEVVVPANRAPLADAGPDLQGTVGVPVLFDGSKSRDFENDTLAFSWSFGDASPPKPGAQIQHSWSTPGTYTVTLAVHDGMDVGQDTVSVTIQ